MIPTESSSGMTHIQPLVVSSAERAKNGKNIRGRKGQDAIISPFDCEFKFLTALDD